MNLLTTIFGIAVAVLLIAVAIYYTTGYRKKPQHNPERHNEQMELEWETLKVRPNDIVHDDHIERMRQSIDKDYLHKVNNAFRNEHPEWSQQKINAHLRGLFRFFILSSVFKRMELFEKEVSLLWEVMRSFDEYEKFCHDFFGAEVTEDASERGELHGDERTRFEVKYLLFFELGYRTPTLWGEFFQSGDGKAFIDWIISHDKEEVEQELMAENICPEAKKTFDQFVEAVKWRASAVSDELREAHHRNLNGPEDEEGDMGYLYFLSLRDELRDEEKMTFDAFTGKDSGFYASQESFGKIAKEHS